MTGRPTWSLARSIAASAGASARRRPERVPLDRAVGRRLAGDLVAPIDLPHFASAAMDGWLVAGEGPWEIVDVAAPAAGRARPIVTGAHVPEASTDPATLTAVLRSESGTVEGAVLRSTVADEPRPGQHIRLPGTEAVSGEVLIASGTALNPAHVALAAATGADELTVLAVPSVALVLTGDEVVETGLPAAGRVRDSFGVQLPALIGMLGGRVTGARRAPDRLGDTIAALSDARADVVITTGGTGGSSADQVRAALGALGARIVVDGVGMRPGGPTRIAELPDGRLVVALPGNPLAAMVAAITLAEPLLAGLAGREPTPVRSVRSSAVAGKPGATALVPYAEVAGRAVVATWRGAAMLRGLAGASGILVVPSEGLHDGESAESLPVPWLSCPRSPVED